jgi:predicted ferric reductase
MMVIHSFQSWFFIAGGVLLYIFDKSIRFLNATRCYNVFNVKYFENCKVTRVQISSTELRKKSFFLKNLSAGHYCWVNVPSIANFEWHPFTVSSSPAMACCVDNTKNIKKSIENNSDDEDDGVVEFSILNLGFIFVLLF